MIPDLIDTMKPSVVKVISIISREGDRINAEVGSGFICTDRGHIITNNHVIVNNRPQSYIIQLSDRRRIQVQEIIHQDAAHDFAIVRITPFEGMQILPLGEYDLLREGEDVALMGYPFGYNQHTTHKGIISSLFEENGDLH